MIVGHLHYKSNGLSGDDLEGDPSQEDDEDYIEDVQGHSPPNVDEGRHQSQNYHSPGSAGHQGDQECRYQFLLGSFHDSA